jgi:hypothetical protein
MKKFVSTFLLILTVPVLLYPSDKGAKPVLGFNQEGNDMEISGGVPG